MSPMKAKRALRQRGQERAQDGEAAEAGIEDADCGWALGGDRSRSVSLGGRASAVR